MTRCPDPGALRAALDGERPDAAAHLAECTVCRARCDEQAEHARLAAAALDAPPPAVDVDAALVRARTRATRTVTTRQRPEHRRWAGMGRVAAALVVVALIGAVLSTPSGRVAAASLLERFRAERVAVVPLDLATVDPAALEALVEVADIRELDRVVPPQEVTDLQAAADIAGFVAAPLDTAALPPTVTGPVRVLAQRPQTVRIAFTASAEVPPTIREAVLVVRLPGAVVQSVGRHDGEPFAVRGEAGTLEVTVEGGPSLGEVRDALLALPGLPSETVAALRAIEDWETTLPLPVPVDGITWKATTVTGRPAVAFGDESGLASALLWHDGRRFVGLGGMLPLSQVRQLAGPR